MLIKNIQMNRSVMVTLSILMTFLTVLFMINSTASRAFAAPAVALIPVGYQYLMGLLAVMGIAVAGVAGYELSQNYPYIKSTFEAAGDSPEDWMKIIPNIYYTDGEGNYYIDTGEGTIPVTSVSQLLLNSSGILSNTWVPTNLAGIPPVVRAENNKGFDVNLTNSWRLYGDDTWFVPYGVGADGTLYVSHTAIQVTAYDIVGCDYTTSALPKSLLSASAASSYRKDFSSMYFKGKDIFLSSARPTYSWISSIYNTWKIVDGYIIQNGAFSEDPTFRNIPFAHNPNDFYTSATEHVLFSDTTYYALPQSGWLAVDGFPTLELVIDKDTLGDTFVSVGGSPQPPKNDDDEDKKGYELVPPDYWQVFETLAEFVGKTPANNTNNSTTLGDFINNNYNYNPVDIDINVPERFEFKIDGDVHLDIDANVTLGGGINLDITINDNTPLPEITGGDGENFFSANVIDVFAGLTHNNPVMAMLFELFRIIDPGLVAIFSVSISLSLLLALWKLIRG